MSDNNLPPSDKDKVVDLTQIQEHHKRIEHEQNSLLSPLWRSLTNIKTPRQAISCASAMIIAGKDLLLLELGEEVTRTYMESLRYDTLELITSQRKAMEDEIERIEKEAKETKDNVVPVDFTKKGEKSNDK